MYEYWLYAIFFSFYRGQHDRPSPKECFAILTPTRPAIQACCAEHRAQ
jgi:hypothetical protein